MPLSLGKKVKKCWLIVLYHVTYVSRDYTFQVYHWLFYNAFNLIHSRTISTLWATYTFIAAKTVIPALRTRNCTWPGRYQGACLLSHWSV